MAKVHTHSPTETIAAAARTPSPTAQSRNSAQASAIVVELCNSNRKTKKKNTGGLWGLGGNFQRGSATESDESTMNNKKKVHDVEAES